MFVLGQGYVWCPRVALIHTNTSAVSGFYCNCNLAIQQSGNPGNPGNPAIQAIWQSSNRKMALPQKKAHKPVSL